MNYKIIHNDTKNYYSIGIDMDSNDYVMEVMITGIAWYSIYFRLSDDEIDQFNRDNNALIDLSQRFAVDKGKKFYKDRLIISDGMFQ